jgi:hypothetical protein
VPSVKRLHEIVPDFDTLLSMDAPELAGVLLEHISSIPASEQRSGVQGYSVCEHATFPGADPHKLEVLFARLRLTRLREWID